MKLKPGDVRMKFCKIPLILAGASAGSANHSIKGRGLSLWKFTAINLKFETTPASFDNHNRILNI
jgi:hypothetical protein